MRFDSLMHARAVTGPRSMGLAGGRRVARRQSVSMVAAAALALVVSLAGVPTAHAASADVPVGVTPYSGFKPTLTRAPYVTDLAQTTAYVNWATSSSTPGSILVKPAPGGNCPSTIGTWTSSAIKVPTTLPGPVNQTGGGSSSSMTGWGFSVVNGANTTIHEYQASVKLAGLTTATSYCYAVFSTDATGAVDLLPSGQSYQLFTTLDPVSTSSTTPVTFDVIADTGENYSNTATNGSVPYPNYVNPDQAAIYKLIGNSGARFVLNAGDISYAGGTQSTYGDLAQTGTNPEVSNIFGPSYYPQTNGIPTFAADGNHGQNVTTLRNWPTHEAATSSGGTYALDSYSGVDGISGTFPDNWYAFSTGNVRIYVLDASWSDGSSASLGSATGDLCTGGPSYCKGYQADADEHWQTTSPEYKWLAGDLAAHQGGVKMAVFHYPLRSDNATQPDDPYLLNSPANPNAATSLEALLANNGVSIAFNGHAHTYQRIVPKQSGQIINYVTGGAGGVLEPVLGGTTCTTLQKTESIYAVGWSPSHTDPGAGTGSACGTNVPASAADVYHFLRVTVTGNSVTVTPTNAAGGTFDQQTYTVSSGGGGSSKPEAPTNVAAATGSTAGEIDVSWTASTGTDAATGYNVYRDGGMVGTVSASKTSYADTGLGASSTHTYTVTAVDAAGHESDLSNSASGTAGAGSGGGGGTTMTVAASDDATISKLAANTGTNYGKLSTLTMDGDQNINDVMMQFTVPTGCTPSAASLTVTTGSGSTSGSSHGGDFYAAPGTWDEGSVTAASAPPAAGSPVPLGAVAINTPYTFNVTSLLPQGVTGGGIVSLRATTSSTDAAVYVSRNASNGSTAGPQLTFTCAVSGT